MKRRQLLGGALGLAAVTACGRGTIQANGKPMSRGQPDKLHLIPDGDRIINVGHLADGRMYFVDGQLVWIPQTVTQDFVCTFLFDRDGHLISHNIELIGTRGSYAFGADGAALGRHLAALEKPSPSDIWVRPFSVQSNGTVFGLVPRQTEDGEWRVTFMPGNTLEFYPPWVEGGYDT